MEDEDSFIHSGIHLTSYIDTSDLQPPTPPPTPFLLFTFEKVCEQKKHIFRQNFHDPSHSVIQVLSEEWQNMDIDEKSIYEDAYEERVNEYNELEDEYNLLKEKKKKILNSYSRFFQQMYAIYKAEQKLTPNEITKQISDDWASLPAEEKQEYQNEYQIEKSTAAVELMEKQNRMMEYIGKREIYERILDKEKAQILKKYGSKAESIILFQKINNMITNVKGNEKKQRKKKQRQMQREKIKKRTQLNYQRLKEIKEMEMMELKAEKEKIRSQETQKKTFNCTNEHSEQEKVEIKQKGCSDEESIKTHKTKKIEKIEKSSLMKTEKKGKKKKKVN